MPLAGRYPSVDSTSGEHFIELIGAEFDILPILSLLLLHSDWSFDRGRIVLHTFRDVGRRIYGRNSIHHCDGRLYLACVYRHQGCGRHGRTSGQSG